MKINTKTNKIELLKFERETFARAQVLLKTLSKHADGEVEIFANRAAEALADLKMALADQGKEEEVAAPY